MPPFKKELLVDGYKHKLIIVLRWLPRCWLAYSMNIVVHIGEFALRSDATGHICSCIQKLNWDVPSLSQMFLRLPRLPGFFARSVGWVVTSK